MKKYVLIDDQIKKYKKKINVSADKSLSIRWVLMAAQAVGKSVAYNLLNSEDVNNSLIAVKKLGVKVIKKKNLCQINGVGLNGFSLKNNTVIDAGNSGTLARLIIGVLAKSNKTIVLKGDKSLSKRDFSRVIKPLKKFGLSFKSNKNNLPLKFKGTNYLSPIQYEELKGSAQVKSSILLAALNTPGKTKVRCLPSRDHTERLFKFLNLPIKIKKNKKYEMIELTGQKQFSGFNYKIPGDISSSAFFIVLTLLSKNSEIKIKNININKSRTGIVEILKKMNAKIKLINKKIYNGEEVSDIVIKSSKNLKSINCPTEINSRAIDELIIIFLVCAKAKGISYFKNIQELRYKESDRLKLSANFLKMIGVEVEETLSTLKIHGNPNLELNKNYIVKNFMKDHRVFMMACIAALTLGGKWKIHDPDSIKTSFPKFLSILQSVGAKIN
jgi:3-phosphoshikimate 1-carboxyvinyltransferase